MKTKNSVRILSGPKHGRPPKAFEGKFGEGKHKYGLGHILASLQGPNEAFIAL